MNFPFLVGECLAAFTFKTVYAIDLCAPLIRYDRLMALLAPALLMLGSLIVINDCFVSKQLFILFDGPCVPSRS